MKIKKINIKNYKSLVDITIENPNPFSVFIGANASGKSNIFEALEFFYYLNKIDVYQLIRMFGGSSSILNFNMDSNDVFKIEMKLPKESPSYIAPSDFLTGEFNFLSLRYGSTDSTQKESSDYKQFFYNFFKLFINNEEQVKIKLKDNLKLSLDASNLEKIFKKILKSEDKKEDIIDWLQLFIPEFENIEIRSDELSGTDNLLVYEKSTKKPFAKHLISDGTYNILALLTAVYQADEPQFLCIEEPENGLNPKAIKELVYLFREQCKQKGHNIWLTTHSQSLVSVLKPEEIIVVDKIEGKTKIKQFQGKTFQGFKMDEAWLSNILGGGLPW